MELFYCQLNFCWCSYNPRVSEEPTPTQNWWLISHHLTGKSLLASFLSAKLLRLLGCPHLCIWGLLKFLLWQKSFCFCIIWRDPESRDYTLVSAEFLEAHRNLAHCRHLIFVDSTDWTKGFMRNLLRFLSFFDTLLNKSHETLLTQAYILCEFNTH